MLLRSQKNKLFDLIQEDGLSPLQFEIYESDTYESREFCLKLINTNFYFVIKPGPDNRWLFNILHSPGEQIKEEGYSAENWDSVERIFVDWIDYLKSEIQQEDKWDRIFQEAQNINIIGNEPTERFNVDEHRLLKHNINTIKGNLAAIPITAEQGAAIIDKLDHLTVLAEKMNKYDWKNLFIGTIISVIIQLGVTPENAKALWSIISSTFNSYFIPQ